MAALCALRFRVLGFRVCSQGRRVDCFVFVGSECRRQNPGS